MFSLRQYLTTLSDPCGLTRTLGEVEVCRDAAGRMCFSVGNSAAVFRIRHEGRIRSLRGYFRPQRHLREIYGERLLEKELFLYISPEEGVWVDVVIGEWIEGESLHDAIARAAAARDTQRLGRLAADFDRLAAALVSDDRAHGDLKPENILVDRTGALHPIDFDAAYLPCFAGERSPELGTAAYQHPGRTAEDFNARLDDYPAALISTALHALSVAPELWERYGDPDMLLYDPRKIAADRALQESLDRFEELGMAVEYRIAQLLYAPRPELFGLPALLSEAVRRADRTAKKEREIAAPAAKAAEQPAGASEMPETTATEVTAAAKAAAKAAAGATTAEATETEATETAETTAAAKATAAAAEMLELFVEQGRWGYRTAREVVVPPLYDNGFDFTEGLAAVLLGRTWHFIDPEGNTRLSCPGCESVKPFRNGRACIVRGGIRREIDPEGREFDF